MLLTAANWDDNRRVAKNSTRNTKCPAALLQLGLMWPKQAGVNWHRSGTENKD